MRRTLLPSCLEDHGSATNRAASVNVIPAPRSACVVGAVWVLGQAPDGLQLDVDYGHLCRDSGLLRSARKEEREDVFTAVTVGRTRENAPRRWSRAASRSSVPWSRETRTVMSASAPTLWISQSSPAGRTARAKFGAQLGRRYGSATTFKTASGVASIEIVRVFDRRVEEIICILRLYAVAYDLSSLRCCAWSVKTLVLFSHESRSA